MTATITKADLIDDIVKHHAIPQKKARSVVDAVINSIHLGVVRYGSVKIPKLGTWSTRVCPARVARNPKTGKKFKTRPKIRVRYKVSPSLKREVNRKRKAKP